MNLRKFEKFSSNALNTTPPLVLRNSKSSGGGVFGTKGTVNKIELFVNLQFNFQNIVQYYQFI